jgi:hypothetical protein
LLVGCGAGKRKSVASDPEKVLATPQRNPPELRNRTMQTLPVAQKNIKAFYCTMYDMHGTITRLDGEYVFMSDEGDLTVVGV